MTSTTGHTVKAFDEELGQLRALISEMGGLAEQAINQAMQALVENNSDLAYTVIGRDHRIDEIQAEIERQVVTLVALRAPMANDLREVIATFKIAGHIERIADYAKNIAKRVLLLRTSPHAIGGAMLLEISTAVRVMVMRVIEAFMARDAADAVQVCAMDAEIDNLHNRLFRTLLDEMMEHSDNIAEFTHLLFVAKNLERIGDYATNIGEMVYFAATGAHLPERIKGDDLLD
jgi:phosphate transport system protein